MIERIKRNNLGHVILKNKILMFAFLAYLLTGFLTFDKISVAIKGTSYYLVEMVQILPAVFILTGLIQTWVPTKTIVKYFGEKSGIKGFFIAFLIGSFSAGPIYAAFPVCRTLLKKGANRRNIMIILSTWAVVKFPMLINEAKFMGFEYMITRWLVTLVGILIMSLVLGLLVKEKDMVLSDQRPRILKSKCIMCKKCVKEYPQHFTFENDRIYVLNLETFTEDHLMVCPVGAITL